MKIINIDHLIDDTNEAEQAVLVTLGRTDVFYTAQCGGIGCTRPQVEGVANVIVLKSVFDSCHYGCQYLSLPNFEDERKALAADFNAYMKSEGIDSIEFDYNRINETQESWIPVLYKEAPAFFHNGNCD